MAVSNTLKQVRTERNICQEDLAIAIGSCRNASLELALRLSKYLDVAVEELFVLEDR